MTIDPAALAASIDTWERYPDPLEDAPLEAFRAAHRTEARYLWLLSRRFAPPPKKDLDRAALRNLVAWGLVRSDAMITPLGRRLLAATSANRTPDPFVSDPTLRRFP